MKKNNNQDHGLEGLKDYTEKKSVASEQSDKIRGSDNKQGWEMKKLGEVLVKTEMVDPSKNPEKEFTYLDVSSVNKETKEIEGATILLGKDAPSRARKLVRENDVIFATVRPTHSRVALITDEYDGQVCSTGYFVLRGKENIDNKYLFYFLLTDEFNQQMEKLQKGASYPAVTDAEVKSIFLRLPKSLPEQQRIVSILDEAFACIERSRNAAIKNLKNAKELFESYLQGVFEKKGDGWEEKIIKEVCDLKSGTTISSNLERSEGDVLYAKVGDMTLPENEVGINTSSRFVNSNEIKSNQIIPNGAIIFPKRGGAIATNKKRKIIKPTIVDLNTMAIIPGNKIDAEYFYHWFQ